MVQIPQVLLLNILLQVGSNLDSILTHFLAGDEINTGNSSSEEGLPVAILVAVIVVPLVILLGVAVIIVILIRRRQNQNEEDSGLELQPVSRNYTNISDTQSGSSLLPPSQPSQSVQHYAKPRIDKEFAAYEVDYYELEFEEKIGAGGNTKTNIVPTFTQHLVMSLVVNGEELK